MRSLNSRIIDKILNPEKDSMIVYDPDGLVDQAVLEELSERGFHVIEYKDPIAFRFEYESEFRDKAKSFLVLTRETPAGELPFDIYSSLLTVDVSLSSIFPKLSRTALESLERWELDRLNDSYSDDLDYLSTRRTREFILKRIYEFDPSKRY
ncbi:MAG: Putative PglZ domain protein, partial [Mesotoga infera]